MICCMNRCHKLGKERKYFVENEMICEHHYNGFMEKFIDCLQIEVSKEFKESTFEKYKVELIPMTSLKKKSKRSGMRM